MKRFILGFLLLSSSLEASETLNGSFARLLRSHKISPLSEQSYCYIHKGEVLGYNVRKKQRIASLTKVLTTLLAIKKSDFQKRYRTRIYHADGRLHIAGGLDPYWEEDKLLLLLHALNELGIEEVDELSFDRNFIFTDLAFSSHADITPEHTRERLQFLLGAGGKKTITSLWNGVRSFGNEEGVNLPSSAPIFRARKVSILNSNPLADQNPMAFVHVSKTLGQTLKAMNVMSKNHVSQNIFREFTRDESFESFMIGLGFKASEFSINNGSGLPTLSLARQDNEASCTLLLRVFEILEEETHKQGFPLSDILAVAGSGDLGSFRNRFRNAPWLSAGLMAKTGTLRHTSSLAGYLSLDTLSPFAILNHTSSAQSARKFQEDFVESLFSELGNPVAIPYEKISIFPWDGEDFLRPLL